MLLKLAVLYLQISNILSQSSCPQMCTCEGKNVTCAEQDLRTIPTDLGPDTVELNLDKNNFNELTGPFFLKPQEKLEQLSTRMCRIEILDPGAFSGLQSLQTLDLAQNLLIYLPADLFKDLGSLKHVTFRGNRLAALFSRAFLGADLIEEIDLSYNHLTEIHKDAFVGLEKLRKIDLRYNNLLYSSASTYDRIPNLAELHLVANRWRCDCALRSLAVWFNHLTLGDAPKCLWPPTQQFKTWSQMTELEFACPPTFDTVGHVPAEQWCSLGATVTFECSLMADPEPVIDWQFMNPVNGTLISLVHQLGKIYTLRIVEFVGRNGWTYTLTVKYVGVNDFGHYYCRAANAANSTSKLFVLRRSDGADNNLVGVKWFPNTAGEFGTKGFSQFLLIIAMGTFLMLVLLLCSGGFLLPRGNNDPILLALSGRTLQKPIPKVSLQNRRDLSPRRTLSVPSQTPVSRKISTMAVISESAECLEPLSTFRTLTPPPKRPSAQTKRAAWVARRCYSQQLGRSLDTVKITQL